MTTAFDGIILISEPQDFKWNKTYKEDYSVFERSGLHSHYDTYSYQILEPTRHQAICVEIVPRLEVFSQAELLFSGELIIYYHILDSNSRKYSIEVILKELMRLAHNEFILAFVEREQTTALNRFRPTFSDEAAHQNAALFLPSTV